MAKNKEFYVYLSVTFILHKKFYVFAHRIVLKHCRKNVKYLKHRKFYFRMCSIGTHRRSSMLKLSKIVEI